MSTVFAAVLILNALWFGAAFRYFSLTPYTAAKVLVPKSAREAPLFRTVAASLPFLGGMNLALALLAVLLLFNFALFPESGQRALFALTFGLAHGSQFACNVPIAWRGGRQGEAFWPVLQRPMLFIFVVDGILALANLLLAGWLGLAAA